MLMNNTETDIDSSFEIKIMTCDADEALWFCERSFYVLSSNHDFTGSPLTFFFIIYLFIYVRVFGYWF